MIAARHSATTILTVLTLLWTGTIMELSHHDIVSGSSASGPVVAQHACGATERHVPLEQIHPCVICAQGSQRVSTPPVSFVPEQTVFVSSVQFPLSQGQPASLAYLFSGKRGPPAGTV